MSCQNSSAKLPIECRRSSSARAEYRAFDIGHTHADRLNSHHVDAGSVPSIPGRLDDERYRLGKRSIGCGQTEGVANCHELIVRAEWLVNVNEVFETLRALLCRHAESEPCSCGLLEPLRMAVISQYSVAPGRHVSPRGHDGYAEIAQQETRIMLCALGPNHPPNLSV